MKTLITTIVVVALAASCSSSDDRGDRDSGPELPDGLPDGSTTPTEGGAGDSAPPKACTQREFPFAFAGMCFAEPLAEGRRTQCGEIIDHCDTSGQAKPRLDCWQGDPPAAPDGPKTVTLAGYIDVFSSGPDADDLTVEIYEYEKLQAAVVADSAAGKLLPKTFPDVQPLATDTVNLDWPDKSKPPEDPTRGPARACPADKKSGLPCVVPSPSCGSTQPYCDLAADQYCHDDHCEDRLRWEVRFRVENIPTNRRLVIRTRGQGEFDDGTWGVMLLYTALLRADAPACEKGQVEHCINDQGAYELEVNAISRADYATIPITAGLAGGVPEGNGALSGEIRDCDGIKLEGVQMATDPLPAVMVYFNGNPIKTLPDLGRFVSGTNIDGLFAALDVRPGAVTVGALGKVDGKETSAGSFEASVLPDSVTVVALDGPDALAP